MSEIDKATGIGQPALSQQLATLRQAGLVGTRRAAKHVFYRLADESVSSCVRNIEAMFIDENNLFLTEPNKTFQRKNKEIPNSSLLAAAEFAKLL